MLSLVLCRIDECTCCDSVLETQRSYTTPPCPHHGDVALVAMQPLRPLGGPFRDICKFYMVSTVGDKYALWEGRELS